MEIAHGSCTGSRKPWASGFLAIVVAARLSVSGAAQTIGAQNRWCRLWHELGLSPRHELQVCITHLTKASCKALDMAGKRCRYECDRGSQRKLLLMWLQRRLISAPQRYSWQWRRAAQQRLHRGIRPVINVHCVRASPPSVCQYSHACKPKSSGVKLYSRRSLPFTSTTWASHHAAQTRLSHYHVRPLHAHSRAFARFQLMGGTAQACKRLITERSGRAGLINGPRRLNKGGGVRVFQLLADGHGIAYARMIVRVQTKSKSQNDQVSLCSRQVTNQVECPSTPARRQSRNGMKRCDLPCLAIFIAHNLAQTKAAAVEIFMVLLP